MNATALDTYFNSVYTDLSGTAPKPFGTAQVGANLYIQARKYVNGAFILTCSIGTGATAQIIRSKSFAGTANPAPKLPAEKAWDTVSLTAYYQSQMDAIFSALPADTQALYAQTYVEAKDFLSRGKNNVAKALIQNAAVTSDLASVKNQLLSYL